VNRRISLKNKGIDQSVIISRQRIIREKKITIKLCIFVTCFFIIWTPYGFASMYTAFIGNFHPLATLVPKVFAKSSYFVSTGYYLLTNKNLLKCLKKKSSKSASLQKRKTDSLSFRFSCQNKREVEEESFMKNKYRPKYILTSCRNSI
jgi:hypothetical protein